MRVNVDVESAMVLDGERTCGPSLRMNRTSTVGAETCTPAMQTIKLYQKRPAVCRAAREQQVTRHHVRCETTDLEPVRLVETARAEVPALDPSCCSPAASVKALERGNGHKSARLQSVHDLKPYRNMFVCLLHSKDSDLFQKFKQKRASNPVLWLRTHPAGLDVRLLYQRLL
uniref:Uncharacterized protein n=1 Tax=Nothobranchius pienaari TaxID=704102 RepID=A0A1A8L6F3_9TELE